MNRIDLGGPVYLKNRLSQVRAVFLSTTPEDQCIASVRAHLVRRHFAGGRRFMFEERVLVRPLDHDRPLVLRQGL